MTLRPISSRAQLERQARNLIRQAYAQGWRSDDLVEDYVAGAMGEEFRQLIRRVHADDFKSFPP
jgi:hypothetical protein